MNLLLLSLSYLSEHFLGLKETETIPQRLANRAKKEINEIENCNTKETLKNRHKKQLLSKYEGLCNIRNCYICSS